MEYLFIINLLIICGLNGLFATECPHSDPDCHPSCVKYVGICKYCQCSKAGFPSESRSASFGGSNAQDNWNSKIVGSYENTGQYFVGKSSTGSRGSDVNAKVIIIHDKDTDSNPLTSMPGGISMRGRMPFNVPHGPMAPQNPFSRQISSHDNSINVPLKSPGIPKYCVAIDKMEFENCGCIVVDENGCQTCPCFSASRFWIAVKRKDQKLKPPPKKEECVGTLLCMMSCKGGYHLGETGPDGCQSCTCLKKVEKKPPPKKSETECLKLYECIIKCSQKKLGFTVGGQTSDGCRSCKCTGEENKIGGRGGMTATNNKWTMGGGGSMTMGNNGGGSMMMGNSNSGGGGNKFLKSPEKGVGISGGDRSKVKCNPPMVQCTNDGNTLIQSMPGGTGGGSTSGGSGGGPYNTMSGGSSSGSGMKSPFSPTSGGSGSGSGMTSPFGSGSGGSMKNPFSGRGPGVGGGMGPRAPTNHGIPSQKKVEESAYNENCFGPSCSAKDGGLVEGTLENTLFLETLQR